MVPRFESWLLHWRLERSDKLQCSEERSDERTRGTPSKARRFRGLGASAQIPAGNSGGMLGRMAALTLLVAALSGCSAYPSFEARVINDTSSSQEVRVEVLRGDTIAFSADREVGAGETWDLGVFTRTEGDYEIRVHASGRLAASGARFFGHDEGPGGFGVHLLSNGTTEISYWNY